MAKYQQYEQYKESGVEWLGEIPKDWSTISLKRKASFITGMTPSTAISAYYSDDVTIYEWVRPEDIKENTEKVCGTKYLTKLGWKTQRKVAKNSVLLCCIGTIGKAGYASKTITTNQQITAVSFKDNSKYNYYLLLAARNELEQMATGNVVKILNSERLGQLSIPKIDLYKANQIANFLDHETAQIDTLIEKQQTLIQLLKEKRQAVISHAVTKGLNPDAPMKDSGVEWLGDVPEHWEVWKFQHIAPIITCGIASTPTYVDEDEGMPFLSAQNIRDNKLSLHKYNYIPYQLHEQLTKHRRPEMGDLLVTRVGAGIGDACVINIEMEFSIYVSLTHIRVNPLIGLNKFVMYFFGSDYCKYLNYQGTVTGGGVGNLNVGNVERYKIPLPDLDEQANIVHYLETESDRFDSLIKKAEQAIQLMQERRTALISAAVTGKIDVRGWRAPE